MSGTCLCVLCMYWYCMCGVRIMGNVCSVSGVALWDVCLAFVWHLWGFCVHSVCVIVWWCMCNVCVCGMCGVYLVFVACMSVGGVCVSGSVCVCYGCVRCLCDIFVWYRSVECVVYEV